MVACEQKILTFIFLCVSFGQQIDGKFINLKYLFLILQELYHKTKHQLW